MIKTKDGYGKLIGTTYLGSSNLVLLSNGGNIEYSSSSKANTLVLRNASLLIYATHFNSAISDESLADIGSVYVRNTSDSFIRRVSKSQFYSIIDGKFVTLDTALTITGNKTFTTQINSTLSTTTYLEGNKGKTIINSTASAGSYVMLFKGNSTNGYFTHGVYLSRYLLQYTSKATVDAGTNSVTKSVTLLDESGNSSFPGIISGNILESRVATGTKPLNITSTTLVTNLNSDRLDNYHETAFPRLVGVKSGTWDWNDLTRAGYYKIQGETISNHPSGVYRYGMALVITTENHADGENREVQIYYPHSLTNNIAVWVRMHNGSTQGNGWSLWKGIPNTDGVTKIKVTLHTTNNTNYPVVWSNQNNTNTGNSDLFKSWDHFYYNPSTKILTSSGGLYTNGMVKSKSIFVNTGDATLKIYSGKASDGNGKSDGNICFQTSINSTDGETHAYPTQYPQRCNISLLPRGGLVYIGTNPSTGNTNYKLYVNGNSYSAGDISGNTLTARVAIGTAPLNITSTTLVNNLNVDFLRGYIPIGTSGSVIRKRGFSVGSTTPAWCRMAKYTVPHTGALTDVAFLLHSSYNGRYSVLHIKSRGGSYVLALLYNSYGMDKSKIRIYHDSGKNNIEFYYYAGESYSVIIAELLYSTGRTGSWDNNVIMYEGDTSSPSYSNYIVPELPTLQNNAETATKLLNPRYLWGLWFDGTANVSGNLDGVGTITGSGEVGIKSGGTSSISFKVGGNDATGICATTVGFRPLSVANNLLDLGTNGIKWRDLYLGRNAYIDGNIGKVNKITSAFSSGTWIGSLKNAVINCNINGFGAWINGKTKNGRIAIATYPADNDKIYIGYAAQSKIDAGTDNSYTTNMTWDGATGKLYTTGNTEAKGFVKHNSSDSYLLLGGGGQKAVSDFALASSLNNYVTLTSALTISGVKTFSSLLKFTVANGTSPFTVSSSTTVTNLNADMLDSLHANSFMRTDGTNGISLTGGNGNTAGWRLVLEETCGAYSICDIVIAVASRHSGQGVLSIGFHTTNESGTTYSYNIQFKGSTASLFSPAWRAFYNTSTKKFRLFWNYSDNNGVLMNVLSRRKFDVPKNGTWYEALPSDNGTELTILYNVASQLGTDTVGSTTVPIYLSAGVPKVCSASTSDTANTIAVRNSVGDIACRLVRPTYGNLTTISGAIAYRINNSTDNYIRFCSDTAAIRTWLGVSSSSHTHTVFNNNLMIKGTNGISSSASIHLGIGDSDTGFKWVSDGACQIYANNVAIGQWDSSGMNWLKLPTVNGLKIWHAGNDGSGSGLDADLLDGWHKTDFINTITGNCDTPYKGYILNFTTTVTGSTPFSLIGGNQATVLQVLPNSSDKYGAQLAFGFGGSRLVYRNRKTNSDGSYGWNSWQYITAGLADAATKLQTPRTLWGQSFDGTKNISGILDGCIGFARNWTDVWDDGTNKHPWYGYDHTHPNTGIYSTTISDFFGMCLKTRDESSIVLLTGKVGIGTTSPYYKLDVAGDIQANGWVRTSGNKGWYAQDWGGGWYMQDSNWIRAFNDKSVYTNGTMRARKLVTTSSGIDITYGNNNEFIRVGYNESDGDFVTFKVPGNNNQSKWMKLSSSKGLYISGDLSITGNITASNFNPNGSSSHPIVLASGYIDVTNGSFHGCKNSRITSITGGVMSSSYRVSINNAVMTSIVVQLRSTTSISGNSTSNASGRSDGAYWFSTYIINNTTANIRCFSQSNSDNDSWISRKIPWTNKLITSISVTIFGYCT